MAITGRAPAEVVLGVAPGAAALTVGGALRAVRAGGEDGPWGALAIHGCLADAGLRALDVEQVAVAEGGPDRLGLRRRRLATQARDVLGAHAAFVGKGLVGTGLPRARDGSDRLSRHAPLRCLAAAGAFTSGERVVVVVVELGGVARALLGTSGKVLDPDLPAGPVTAGQIATWRAALRAEPVVYVADHDRPCPLEGVATAPVWGAQALAAGAALLARADERQGAWVPARWSPRA